MKNTHCHEPTSELVITHLEQQADGLTLRWSDGHQIFFHAIWLRDCCYCDRCGDSYSSKRIVALFSYDRNPGTTFDQWYIRQLSQGLPS